MDDVGKNWSAISNKEDKPLKLDEIKSSNGSGWVRSSPSLFFPSSSSYFRLIAEDLAAEDRVEAPGERRRLHGPQRLQVQHRHCTSPSNPSFCFLFMFFFIPTFIYSCLCRRARREIFPQLYAFRPPSSSLLNLDSALKY